MSSCAEELFPGFSNGDFLCGFHAILELIADAAYDNQNEIAMPFLLINIFHFIILTRKSMRISSINVLIAAVAFADMCSFLYATEQILTKVLYIHNRCLFSGSYWKIVINLKLDALAKCARKCSTWFSLFVVLIRTLVVRNPLNSFYQNLTNPPAAYKTILGAILLFSPLFVVRSIERQVYVFKTTSICKPNQTFVSYGTMKNEDFLANDRLIMKIVEPVDSILSNIIPCILFPIVTAFLVKEIWKFAKNQQRIASSRKSFESQKTTKMVLLFAVTYFISGFPLGIASALVPYYINGIPGIESILYCFIYFFGSVVTLNTVTHFFVCGIMSADYRKTMLSVVRCGKEKSSLGVVVHLQVLWFHSDSSEAVISIVWFGR
ncbi:Protein CBG06355 [Caenorhabditis briggsae]|uniref:Protein CBG06355 n=1 Tax=Caenorhabditis briggsae TaxID=6238 RepID=A8X218_CAEBR|nr:Protein CBG06355 [Caenorhabditis briggsae]CAP26678.2 Protein CBG06355 [Caenorhabditis briggsae]